MLQWIPTKKEMHGFKPSKPQLSVVISSYNSSETIGNCLKSLENQITERQFEIIVVDSSNDGTASWIEKRFPQVKLQKFPKRKYVGNARNIGISLAKSEIIAFIDADCVADRNWIDEILRAHQEPHLAIGGSIGNGNPRSYIGWGAYFCEFSRWMPDTSYKWLVDVAGANMSYKREVFQELGLFIEETYCSDTDFHWRLMEKGRRIRFVPSILIFHHNIERFREFLKHEFCHGRDFAQVRAKSKKFSLWRRSFYMTFSFLLPVKLFIEISIRNFQNRIFLLSFLKVIPLLLLGLASWSIGEGIGYARG